MFNPRIRCVYVSLALLVGATVRADLDIGDDAPPLSITKWVKGEAVDLSAMKGKSVVVLEFWATWCGPCIEFMPHLTELQKKYAADGLVIIGCTKPDPNNEIEKVEAFVTEQPERMGYRVAFDGDKITNEAYMKAANQQFIPASFIIDRAGKIAWIGHPQNIDQPLAQILANKHDLGLFKLNQVLDARYLQTRSSQAWEDAARVLRAKAILNPENAETWTNLVSLYLGPAKSPEKAAEAAAEALRLAWDHPGQLNGMASTISVARSAESLQPTAVKAARRAIELKPEDAELKLTLISALAAAKQIDAALDEAQRSLDLIAAKEPVQLNGLIRTLTARDLEKRGMDLAHRAVEKALTADIKSATTFNLLALTIRSLDDPRFPPLAVKASRRALEMKPEDGRLILGLVQSEIAAGNLEGALAAAEQDVDKLLTQDAFVLSSLAEALSSPKLKGKGAAIAMKTLEAALAAKPDDLNLLETRFKVQALALNDRAAALMTGTQFLEKASTNAAALNSFAWALLTEDGLKGQFNSLALQVALKSHEASGGEHWAYLDTLALAKFETGAKHEAVELERKSLELARKAGVTSLKDLEDALARFEKEGGAAPP